MFDNLLDIALKENAPKTFADKIVEQSEANFLGPSNDADQSRKEEKESLLLKLKELRKRLAKTKNVKSMNALVRQRNNLSAEKRKQINEEIERIKDKLFIISEETLGSKIDPETLLEVHMNNSRNANDASVTGWKAPF